MNVLDLKRLLDQVIDVSAEVRVGTKDDNFFGGQAVTGITIMHNLSDVEDEARVFIIGDVTHTGGEMGMSKQFNTDGLMVVPSDNEEPITSNAFESIECAIAFDVRDWSNDRRSAWIYGIVFGWEEDSWNKIAEKFGWDEEDRKRASMMHEQWMKAKEAKEQPEISVRLERIKEFLEDNEEDWYMYETLRTDIRRLEILLEQEGVI